MSSSPVAASFLPRVPDVVDAVAAAHASAVAVVQGDVAWTYATLRDRSDRVAAALRAAGVRPGEVVGVAAHRTPTWVAGVFGVLKAGGVYLPLAPSTPPERLRLVLDAARPTRVLSAAPARFEAQVRSAAVPVDALDDAVRFHRTDAPALACRADDAPAYLLFTSGSTGRPKGCLLSHGGWANLARAQQTLFGLGPGERVLQAAPLHFDASIWELSMALGGGATLVLPASHAAASMADALADLDRLGVTAATLTPSVLATLRPDALPALRTVVAAGEACPTDLAHRWAAGPGRVDRRVFNAYGPTEATVCATVHRVRPGVPVTLGRPLPGVSVYVLDADGCLAAPGEDGELCIGGAGVGLGYVGQPLASARRFVPDPFAGALGGAPGARLYRTGDRACVLPSGEIAFRGRLDRQVQVRGHRVEPAEVEAALRAHPHVSQAVVTVARPGTPGASLVAHVTPAPPLGETRATPDALRDGLAHRLPSFLVPDRIAWVDAFPLTPTGKVDLHALAATASPPDAAPDVPDAPIERGVVDAWAEIVGSAPPDGDANFFACGGTSLLAVALAHRLGDAFDVQVAPSVVYDRPTVAALAAWLDAAIPATSDASPEFPQAHASATARSPAVHPALPGQDRLWCLHRLAPESPAYHVPFAFRLTGRLDLNALQAALDALARRHDALRTTFAERSGDLRQIVAPDGAVRLAVADLSAVPTSRGARETRRVVDAAARAPFDLTAGPLLRAHLVRRDAADHVLLLVAHHVVVDEASGRVLLGELGRLYRAACGLGSGNSSGLDDVLPPLALNGSDVARTLGGATFPHATPPACDAPPPDLPTDRPRPSVPSFVGDAHRFAWPAPLARRIEAFARQHATTPTVVTLAAFHALLHRYTGQPALASGLPVSRRTRSGLRDVVGYLVDLAPICTDVADAPTGRALLRRVHDAVARAMHRPADAPPAPAALRTAFSVSESLPTLDLPGVTADAWPVEPGGAKFDLHVHLTVPPDSPPAGGVDGGVTGRIEYDTALFDAARIEAMAAHLRVVLTGLMDAPDTRVAGLPLLSDAERRRLVVDANRTAAPLSHASVPARFAAQVARTPDAVAVRCDAGELTYRALDRRSTALAHALVARGIAVGDRVAVCVPRTPARIVALLAVLKAGAAYVPLEPDLPAPRLHALLDDADVALAVVGASDATDWPVPTVRLRDSARGPASRDPASGGHLSLPDVSLPTVHARAAAYLTYTSGSTGRPKGVLVEHRSVLRLAADPGYVDAGPGTAFLHLAPVAFDASTFELWAPLLNGGCCVLAPEALDAAVDLDRLDACIRHHGVTTLWLTASLFNTIVDARPTLLAPPPLASTGHGGVRHVLTGGEALSVPHVRAARSRNPALRITNGYGPTECTTFATTHDIGPTVEGERVPIGRPIANTTAYVLDAHLEPVPAGVDGTLFVGGLGVARGYHGDPRRTAERFVPDPFAADGSRMYCTGDVARWRRDGMLDVLGRRDRQLKIRGHRVEPGAVEHVLCTHPAVRQSAVVVRSVPRGLVAFVVTDAAGSDPAGSGEAISRKTISRKTISRAAISGEALRAFVAERLPGAAVPSVVHVVDALPLTPNGKLDRRALQRRTEVAPTAPPDAPQTDAEAKLARVCRTHLGGVPVGRTDDLFALGLDSLAVARVAAAATEAGLPLSARDVYACPTVAALAARAARIDLRRDALPASVVPLRLEGTGPPLVLVGVTWYRDLVARLAPGTPVVGLLPIPLDDVDPADAVSRSAAAHLRVLRAIQPTGPYRLAGFCFNGLVAFEMAGRLRAAGEAVDFLGLIDAVNPAILPNAPDASGWERHVAGLRDDGLRYARTWLRRRIRFEGERLRRSGSRMWVWMRKRLGRPAPPDFWSLTRARVEGAAVEAYRPAPYDGPLTLFRCMDGADQQRLATVDPSWGWDAVTTGVTRVDVPGDHTDAFRPPHVDALARALDAHLPAAASGAPLDPALDAAPVPPCPLA